MRRSFTPVLLCLAAFGLSACMSDPIPTVQDRIEVQRAEYVHEFKFANGQAALSGAEQTRMRQFMNRIGMTETDRVIMSIPGNIQGNGYEARKVHLAGILAPSRAKWDAVGTVPGEAVRSNDGRGILRVVRATKSKIRCDVVDGTLPGCATSRNLAVMLENPNDLLVPVGPHRAKYVPKKASENKPSPAPKMSE